MRSCAVPNSEGFCHAEELQAARYPITETIFPDLADVEGMAWAVTHGYAYISRMSKDDAKVILSFLKVPPEDVQ